MTGKVRVKLHRSQAVVDGTSAPYGLYDEKLATYGVGDKFNHDAASGFIANVPASAIPHGKHQIALAIDDGSRLEGFDDPILIDAR